MCIKLTAMAACLQGLFTTVAEQAGRSTRFIQRQRRLTASGFAQTLIFQWMAKPKTTMEAMARHLDLSPEGLRQRLGPEALEFLRTILVDALKNVWRARSERLELLDGFSAVVAEDSSTISLPAELADEFPGCGGREKGDGAAALKINIRWDVRSGELHHLSVHSGRTSDKVLAATAADLPKGSLHLADQGYFNTERCKQFGAEKYWISRVPAATTICWKGVWQTIGVFLATVQAAVFDGAVLLTQKTELPCRLVALRCPQEVASRRRQKLREYTRSKKGREPSAEQLRACDWTIFATNVPVDTLAAKELWFVYRCRWQIELLFKRAKQQLGLAFSWGKSKQRILVELYAKLIGLIVTHWTALLRGGPLCGVSHVKLFQVVEEFAVMLRINLNNGPTAVEEVLRELTQQLAHVRRQSTSRKKPSTRQTLANSKVAA